MYLGGHTCSLATGTSAVFGKKHIETKFHRFPKDHAKCTDWIENCNSINLPTIDPDVLNKNHRLCSLHFEDEMYLNNKKNRLSNQAIPTLFNSNIIRTEDQSSQHDQHVNISSVSLDDNTQIESVIIDNPPRCSTSIVHQLTRVPKVFKLPTHLLPKIQGNVYFNKDCPRLCVQLRNLKKYWSRLQLLNIV